jgi:hypothetical protein
MTAARNRLFAWLAALLALSVVLIACGSDAPARPPALGPSNPSAPESPTLPRADEAAAADPEMNMDMSADAGATPTQHVHDHKGSTPPAKDSK